MTGIAECAICLAGVDSRTCGVMTPCCQNIFHEDCLGQWCDEHHACPICKKYLEVIETQPISRVISRFPERSTMMEQMEEMQRVMSTFLGQMKTLEDKVKELTDENENLKHKQKELTNENKRLGDKQDEFTRNNERNVKKLLELSNRCNTERCYEESNQVCTENGCLDHLGRILRNFGLIEVSRDKQHIYNRTYNNSKFWERIATPVGYEIGGVVGGEIGASLLYGGTKLGMYVASKCVKKAVTDGVCKAATTSTLSFTPFAICGAGLGLAAGGYLLYEHYCKQNQQYLNRIINVMYTLLAMKEIRDISTDYLIGVLNGESSVFV